MADIMDTLKELLGDDAEDKIKSVMSALGDTGSSSQQEGSISPEDLLRLKSIADQISNPSDARSNLLLSLKPYMRSSRQKGIDNAVKLLGLSKIGGLFH